MKTPTPNTRETVSALGSLLNAALREASGRTPDGRSINEEFPALSALVDGCHAVIEAVLMAPEPTPTPEPDADRYETDADAWRKGEL